MLSYRHALHLWVGSKHGANPSYIPTLNHCAVLTVRLSVSALSLSKGHGEAYGSMYPRRLERGAYGEKVKTERIHAIPLCYDSDKCAWFWSPITDFMANPQN